MTFTGALVLLPFIDGENVEKEVINQNHHDSFDDWMSTMNMIMIT